VKQNALYSVVNGQLVKNMRDSSLGDKHKKDANLTDNSNDNISQDKILSGSPSFDRDLHKATINISPIPAVKTLQRRRQQQ